MLLLNMFPDFLGSGVELYWERDFQEFQYLLKVQKFLMDSPAFIHSCWISNKN